MFASCAAWQFQGVLVSDHPIADYALLSDCHSAALVSSTGSVDWLCFPRFDAPSVFGRLLDESAGHWSIRIAGNTQPKRRYMNETMALETTFRTANGTAILHDAMALGLKAGEHNLGANAPRCLLRSISCTDGEVEVDFEYAPRPEFGLVIPLLKPMDGGVLGRGGPGILFLSSPVELEIREGMALGHFRLKAGETLRFALQQRLSWEEPCSAWPQKKI